MEARKLNNQEKLDHMFEMVNELNAEMHHLKKQEAAAGAFRLFYMAIIVAGLAGAYYFVLPLFDTIKKAPGFIDNATQKVQQLKQTVTDTKKIEGALDTIKEQGISADALKKLDPESLKNVQTILEKSGVSASTTFK